MTGAIHRLQREHAMLGRVVLGVEEGCRRLHREHVVGVPAPVAGGLPQRLVEQLRPLHLLIILGEPTAHVGDQLLEHGPAVGVPEHDTGTFLLEVVEVHLAAELAMVALLRFLDLLQVGGELRLGGKGGAVNALQLRVLRVAAPVGAGELGELEGLADAAGGGHVRATAQVHPFALGVDFQVLTGRDRIDQLDLEQLALRAKEVLRLVAAPHLFGEGSIAGDDLGHPLLDPRQVLRQERLGLGEIVEEAILDHRADRHLGARPELLDCLRQHVRAIMPDELERLGIGARHELDRGIGVDRIGKIAQYAVERHRHRALGQRRRDRFCDIEAGAALGNPALGAVGHGEGDFGHRVFSFHSLPTTQVKGR